MDHDPESALVEELRALAGPAARGQDAFVVVRDGLPITVRYAGGSSRSLTLAARYDDVARAAPPGAASAMRGREVGYRHAEPRTTLKSRRPLGIRLQAETESDRSAKASGVNREHQTGDRAFDDRVYIHTAAVDDSVVAAVIGPEVRAAVIALFDLGYLHVSIDDDGEVRAFLATFAPDASAGPVPHRGAQALEAFARILRHVPIVNSTGAPEAVPFASLDRALSALGVIGLFCAIPMLGVTASELGCFAHRGDNLLVPGCGWPLMAAVPLAGLAAWTLGVVTQRAARARLTGRTDSAERIESLRSGAWLSALGPLFVLAYALVVVVSRGG